MDQVRQIGWSRGGYGLVWVTTKVTEVFKLLLWLSGQV